MVSTEAWIGIGVAVVAAVVLGKTLSAGRSNTDERDETINNPDNISHGGRSRRNRQRKNKSRRR